MVSHGSPAPPETVRRVYVTTPGRAERTRQVRERTRQLCARGKFTQETAPVDLQQNGGGS